MRKHSRGVQLISLDFINFPWITKTGVSNFELVIRQKISEKNLYCAGGRTDGDKKCPSIFFILCAYTDYVYIYLYVSSKFVTNTLMGFKILCQVGGHRQKF